MRALCVLLAWFYGVQGFRRLRSSLRVNRRAEDFPAQDQEENEQDQGPAQRPGVRAQRPVGPESKQQPQQHQNPEQQREAHTYPLVWLFLMPVSPPPRR